MDNIPLAPTAPNPTGGSSRGTAPGDVGFVMGPVRFLLLSFLALAARNSTCTCQSRRDPGSRTPEQGNSQQTQPLRHGDGAPKPPLSAVLCNPSPNHRKSTALREKRQGQSPNIARAAKPSQRPGQSRGTPALQGGARNNNDPRGFYYRDVILLPGGARGGAGRGLVGASRWAAPLLQLGEQKQSQGKEGCESSRRWVPLRGGSPRTSGPE